MNKRRLQYLIKRKYIGKNKRVSKRFLMIIFILLFVIILFFISVGPQINTHIEKICQSEIKNKTTLLINECISKITEEDDCSYECFSEIKTGNDGKVTSVTVNRSKVNDFCSKLSLLIAEKYEKQGRIKIGIYLGDLSDNALFHGKGPKINVYLINSPGVETEICSDFTEKGINQSLHRIILKVKTENEVIFPFEERIIYTENYFVIAENVIVGDVPESYTNFEGDMDSNIATSFIR